MNKKAIDARFIVMVCAVLLVIAFFVLPVTRALADVRMFGIRETEVMRATGLQYSIGAGEFMRETMEGARPLGFFLLLIPIVMAVLAWQKKSYAILRNVAIAGVLSKIVFLIWAIPGDIRRELRTYLAFMREMGADVRMSISPTVWVWITLVIYLALAAFLHYSIMQGDKVVQDIPGGASAFCPNCGSSMATDSDFCGNCGHKT
ncbi:MAG: zinc ribbon domain-containing protein [Oscillospiraceae bacterium]|nr:zinc ribbon domain-containing protein [Oscillospiraceae bacterium]